MSKDLEARMAELMRRSQQGDSEAYQELLRELASLMRRFAQKALFSTRRGDDGSVEDLVQETLLALHTKRHTYDPSQPFLPWAYAIARHKAVDRLRSSGAQKRLVDNLTLFVALDEQEVPAKTTARADDNDVHEALATLPENQRRIIELTKPEGLSVSEAAHETGLSESNVKVITHRALKALKQRLTGGSDEDR